MVTNLAPKRVGLLGFDGVTALHLTGPSDVFTAAALEDGYGGRIRCYEVILVGLTSASFQTESGMIFAPQKTLRSASSFDTIIIPGGSGLQQPDINRKISDWLRKHATRTRRIASVCTGIYGLAPTGLLDGREVTTHWRFARDLARRFPTLRVNHRSQIVKDGPFYTSTGLTAGVHLSLKLVEEDYGPQMSLSLERELVTYLMPRDAREDPSEPLYFPNQATERFAQLIGWMLRNLNEDLSVDVLARRACMGIGSFNRVFKSILGCSPATFVENLRLNEARRRLSTGRKTLHSVAESVGFKTSTSFRRAFERKFGARPMIPPGDSPSKNLGSAPTRDAIVASR